METLINSLPHESAKVNENFKKEKSAVIKP
jgi:hypothetical protein